MSVPQRPVKRTYGSRTSRTLLNTSSPTPMVSSDTVVDDGGSPTFRTTLKRKRQFEDEEDSLDTPIKSLYQSSFLSLSKKKTTSSLSKPKKENRGPIIATTASSSSPVPLKKAKLNKGPPKKSTSVSNLTQLHLAFTTSIKTCPTCDLSYTCGSPDDERLHKQHCSRVTRGMEWGKDEEKSGGVMIVDEDVKLKDGKRGRIVSFRATDVKGKLKTKLATLMDTINLALSAPPLPEATMLNSKVYLLLSSTDGSSSREKIFGCAIATRIKTAMAIVPNDKKPEVKEEEDVKSQVVASSQTSDRSNLVWVDGDDGGTFCDPTPLSTPMGIPRLFVPSEYRHKGVATALLTAAARTFVHGCPLDPLKGEVAFSQPTFAGKGVMMQWGKGHVRIFEE